MLGTLSMINRARKRPLQYLIIPTMFDRRTRAAIEMLRKLNAQYPRETLSNTVIPVDTKFREASLEGIPLPLYNPRTRGAVSYSLLFDDLTRH